MEGGGGHILHPHSLGTGISAPPTPNFRVLFGSGRGHKSVLSQIPRFTSLGHTHSPVCPPRPPFPSAQLWVIQYHPLMHYRIYSQYHIMHEKKILGHSRPLRPPPRIRHWPYFDWEMERWKTFQKYKSCFYCVWHRASDFYIDDLLRKMTKVRKEANIRKR